MRVALVHDYIKEYGGAERVLEALCELYPDAPIYTAFFKEESDAYKRFSHRKIIASWAQNIPFFATKLHSPLRFLAPLIWGSFNFKEYDVVITSASWYITKGVVRKPESPPVKAWHWRAGGSRNPTIEICYCHTPPRWLYGYKTSVEWQKYWPVKVYAAIIGHFMRLYDFRAAQKVDFFIANSKNVQVRIKKFYKRDSVVIYPPVDLGVGVGSAARMVGRKTLNETDTSSQTATIKRNRDYYLVVSRLVGAKGLDLAVKAAKKKGFKLKIAGASSGYGSPLRQDSAGQAQNIEWLGRVSDEELVHLYSNAKGFLALAEDEDFGITPVEAMLCGTPVIAYKGGGYVESVVDGKTGIFFNEQSVDSLIAAIEKFEKTEFNSASIKEHAQKFSKERFKKEIKEFVDSKVFRYTK